MARGAEEDSHTQRGDQFPEGARGREEGTQGSCDCSPVAGSHAGPCCAEDKRKEGAGGPGAARQAAGKRGGGRPASGARSWVAWGRTTGPPSSSATGGSGSPRRTCRSWWWTWWVGRSWRAGAEEGGAGGEEAGEGEGRVGEEGLNPLPCLPLWEELAVELYVQGEAGM